MAKKQFGDVPKIEWADPAVEILEAVDDTPKSVQFDWEPEEQAEKYSLCIEGAGTVDILVDDMGTTETDDDIIDEGVEVEFEVCYSAVDDVLIIPVEDILADLTVAILAELGVEMEDVVGGELLALDAKVKGLDPHDKEDMKRQNNEFSEKEDLMEFFN